MTRTTPETSKTTYDVVIVGGGPAGSAAAIAAVQRDLSVLVVERGEDRRPGTCAGWLGPAAIKLCATAGVEAAAVGTDFAGLCLRSWDLKQCVEVADKELKGVVVEQPTLGSALLAAAEADGAAVLRGTTVTQLHLGDKGATLRLSDERAVEGQVVLIADGAASPATEMTYLPPARLMTGPRACAIAVCATKTAGRGLDVILGAGSGLKLATIARGRTEIRVALLTHDDSMPATAQLAVLMQAARVAGVLPRTFDAVPVPVPCLAGVALDLETHIGKRCLLIGDAGGFVTSMSNEGIYPALRSGWLAAEIVARALKAPVLQDELASFSALWRADLADYLRMPNTDLGLLLPMVFSNPQMSRRLARAFLMGQGF